MMMTRFAPSPTGLLHLGNVRTALLNWLYARRYGGQFLLRFEDTDADRSQKVFIEAIRSDLRWLGLDWDGEVKFQSAHAGQHRDALRKLADQGLAYRCFCSEHQLNLDRRLAASRGLPPRYSGRCRELNVQESASRGEREPHVWRLAVHAIEGVVEVPDSLRGSVTFNCADLDDPVVARSDGSFTFLLPNAVDDAIDGITHVLRGDDHLTNSSYQVWLLLHLGYQPPVYLHHGLLLGSDGSKLSKRSGSHSVAELREDGLLPQALLQAMARLGHPNMPEDASLETLVANFTAEHLSTSAVRWQDDELWRWHTRLLHALPVDDWLVRLQHVVPAADAGFAALVQGNLQRIGDALHYARLLDVQVVPDDDAMDVARQVGDAFYAAAIGAWEQHAADGWKAWADAVKQATGAKGRELFMPLRVALSGATHGPEMSGVVAYLGSGGVRARLEDIREKIRI
ncbi:MAG: glutamate--tRNA ligase [Zetaproteobacteria bacterium CG2_30_59_37]|nr:MAG: glutamate--tRNA ligase [Zetaproteobacteria bacterium CG2_30_59_37]